MPSHVVRSASSSACRVRRRRGPRRPDPSCDVDVGVGRDRGDHREELLHRRLHLGIVDALLGAEHDRALACRSRLVAELVLQVSMPRVLSKPGGLEVLAEAAADGAGDAADDDDADHPEDDDAPALAEAPRTKASEHGRPPGGDGGGATGGRPPTTGSI